jgi:hypothetical protein
MCVNEIAESCLCQARASDENFGDAGQVIANDAKELVPRAAVATVLPRIADVIFHMRYVRFLRIELLNLSMVLVDQDHGA